MVKPMLSLARSYLTPILDGEYGIFLQEQGQNGFQACDGAQQVVFRRRNSWRTCPWPRGVGILGDVSTQSCHSRSSAAAWNLGRKMKSCIGEYQTYRCLEAI